ncbi:pentatricopeptide repeat-containing protein, mitochondrial [Iris pallida]|uniref:Pentatricopeptide repeat-containing protein, mitochondrial n=1 Tax=Iris pallida TaxID=29817 RepID=A0AAX6EUY1_IRIPA|nr:pentatricopeptide repeat-containing protein, mitochondrial [Iris pallida]
MQRILEKCLKFRVFIQPRKFPFTATSECRNPPIITNPCSHPSLLSTNPNPNPSIPPNKSTNLSGDGDAYGTPNFGESVDFDKEEIDCDSDSEEADIDDDDFKVLDLFNKNSSNGEEEEVVVVEERDESRHPMVRETCRLIGLRSEWNPKLEAELRHLLRSLSPRQLAAVLRDQSDERVAVSFFYWGDRQWRYRHPPEAYYTMLEILSKTRLCMASRRIFRLMIRRRISRRGKDFGFLMLSYSRAGKIRSALRVLSFMQKDGCSADVSVCNTAIHVLVVANRLGKAMMFLDRMERVGIKPDVVTFNCLIKGLCDVYRVDEALEMIREMPFKGCNPDKVSYYR